MSHAVIEPIVMTFRLSPDVLEQALPSIRHLSALQGNGNGKDPAPAPPNVPSHGEERMPTDTARAMIPESHEGISSVDDEEDVKRPARRGRIPGLYRVVENAAFDADTLTPSALAIYRVMQARVRKAATATAIAHRLKMSSGTVGWALAELRKVGLVEYLPKGTVKDE